MTFMEIVFPSELKLAKVFPIFKSGDSTKMSNYNPISILSFFFSKIFEKLMYNIVNNLLYIRMISFTNTSLGLEKHTVLSMLLSL